MSEEQVGRIETVLLERAREVGALYDLDEIIVDSQWWMEKHDKMFPGSRLTEIERKEILTRAVREIEDRLRNNMLRLERMRRGEIDDSTDDSA